VCTSVGFQSSNANVRAVSLSVTGYEEWKWECKISEREKTHVKMLVFVIIYQNIITSFTSEMPFLYRWHHRTLLFFKTTPPVIEPVPIKSGCRQEHMKGTLKSLICASFVHPFEDKRQWYIYFESKDYLDNLAATFLFIAVKIALKYITNENCSDVYIKLILYMLDSSTHTLCVNT